MISKLDLEIGLTIVATGIACILRNQYKAFGPKNCKAGKHSVSGLNTVCFYGNQTGVEGLISRHQKLGYERIGGYVQIFNENDPIHGYFTEIRDPGKPFELIAENAPVIASLIVDLLLKKLDLDNPNNNKDREKYINKIIDLSQNSVADLQTLEKTLVNTQENNSDNCEKLVA